MATKQQRIAKSSDLAKGLITDAAVMVFAQKGYHGATMDEIARVSGYSPSALYKYFRNKDEVFMSVLHVISEGFLSTLEAPPLPGTSFRSRLFLIQSRALLLIEKNQELFKAFTLSRNQMGDAIQVGMCGAEAQAHLTEVHELYFERVCALMREGVASGALRDAPAEHHALAFIGIGEMFTRSWVFQPTTPITDLTESIIAFFFDGARRLSS
jgi:AcrR family transcriptional regulator